MIHEKQWYINRLNGIGGSEASTVLGINPWQSRLELYYRKVNKYINEINTNEDNLIFNIGHALEPIIAEYYTKITKRNLISVPQQIHPEYPFMLGNIDRKIIKSERLNPGVLEIKTKGTYTEWDNDIEIPSYYIAQLQHYLAVTGLTWGSFAVLDLGSRKIDITDIERDENFISKLITEEKKFWDLVQNKTPPEPEPTKEYGEFLKKNYNTSEPISIDISNNEKATEFAKDLKHVKESYKNLEKLEVECKNFFMDTMKNAEKATGKDYTITWKNDKDSLKFDIDKFKTEHPILYKKFLETKKGSRRFLIKFNEIE